MKFLLCLLTVFFISCKGDNSNTPKTGDADDPNGRQEDSAQNQNLPAGFFTLVNNTSDKAIVFLPLKPGERAEKAAEISAGECLALAQEHFSSLDLVSLFGSNQPCNASKNKPCKPQHYTIEESTKFLFLDSAELVENPNPPQNCPVFTQKSAPESGDSAGSS